MSVFLPELTLPMPIGAPQPPGAAMLRVATTRTATTRPLRTAVAAIAIARSVRAVKHLPGWRERAIRHASRRGWFSPVTDQPNTRQDRSFHSRRHRPNNGHQGARGSRPDFPSGDGVRHLLNSGAICRYQRLSRSIFTSVQG